MQNVMAFSCTGFLGSLDRMGIPVEVSACPPSRNCLNEIEVCVHQATGVKLASCRMSGHVHARQLCLTKGLPRHGPVGLIKASDIQEEESNGLGTGGSPSTGEGSGATLTG